MWSGLGEAGGMFYPDAPITLWQWGKQLPRERWCSLRPIGGNLLPWDCTLHPPKWPWQRGRGCPWHSFPWPPGTARALKPPQVEKRRQRVCQKLCVRGTPVAVITGNAGFNSRAPGVCSPFHPVCGRGDDCRALHIASEQHIVLRGGRCMRKARAAAVEVGSEDHIAASRLRAASCWLPSSYHCFCDDCRGCC